MRRMITPGGAGPQAAPEPSVKIPHDPVNEQVLLAAAVIDASARAKLVDRLKPDAFLVREHVEAWLALTELTRRKLDYDPATIRQLSGGKVDVAYLEQLAEDRASVPANLDHHVSMLEWDRTRIDAVRGPVAALLEAIRDPVTPPERVRSLATALSETFARGTTASLLREPNALVQSALVELRERRNRACYPYGINGLDMQDDGARWRMVPGAAPGKVTVITGVPGSGKSTVVARMALSQAKAGRRVVYGAWEMGDEGTLELLAAMSLGWSRYRLSTGELSDREEQMLAEEMERLSQNIRFVGVPGAPRAVGNHTARGERATNERALDQIHAMLTDAAADVFIADLWKRCLRQVDPDEEELALVRQQAIAAQTKCHCILLQQQRLKDIESRDDKRPTREGIKGSGAWVEIADTIIGVHRAALWKSVDDSTLELDVLKQRWGPWPMAVEFAWDSDRGSISGGCTVAYDQPRDGGGAGGGDDFLAPMTSGARKNKRRGKP
jgi:replicative DNA helicase